MRNTRQDLFILTSNHRRRKGLLLIPGLPGNLEDDAWELIMVARNTALYTWSPPMLFVLCRVGRMLPPEHNAAVQRCVLWRLRWAAGHSLLPGPPRSWMLCRKVGSLQSLWWIHRQPLVSVHSLARLETVTSVWRKAHPKILHLTDYFLKSFWTKKSIWVCVFNGGEALGFD